MAVKLQFISPASGFINLKDDITVPLTFSLGDIRDITKKSGTFSKSIKVPGTKENKQLLSELYNLNIEQGDFNINKIQKIILVDDAGTILLNNGIAQLIDVTLVNPTFVRDYDVEFTLFIKDTTGDFITSMGNKTLQDLNFDAFNYKFNQLAVTDSWDNTWVDGYKYIMPFIDPINEVTDNIFHLTEFKPAIYARQYLDAIFASNGYSYTWTSMDSTKIQFSKLLHPYNGDVPKLSQDAIDKVTTILQLTGVTNTLYTTIINGIVNLPILFVADELFPTDIIKDLQNQFNIITNNITIKYDALTPGGVDFEYDIDYDFIIAAPTDISYVSNTAGGIASFTPLNNITRVLPTPLSFHNVGLDEITVNDGDSFLAGETVVKNSVIRVSNIVNNVNAFNEFKFGIGLRTDGVNGVWTDISGDPVAGVGYKIRINSLKISAKPLPSTAASYGSIINLNDYIPKNIKQADYIKSICTMFNLLLIPNEDDATNIIIQSRDEFYDQGLVSDLSDKLAKDKPQSIQFLPDVTSKKITLSYKQDTDEANKGYLENVNEVYGQVDVTFDSEYVKNEEKKEIIFSPTPNLTTGFGANLPYILGSAPKNNMRILYDGGILPCGIFRINEVGDILSPFITDYPFVGHFDKPSNPTYDLNFAQCDYYFYNDFGVVTQENLYNKFWRRTFNNINEGRLLTAYFKLNNVDVSQLKLNTKIYLSQYNKYFIINKIIDYNANGNELTKVELYEYNDNIRFAKRVPFVPAKNPIKVTDGSPILAPIKLKSLYRFVNLNNDVTGTAKIVGFNNLITTLGSNAIVVGSNNLIDAPNAVIYSDNEVVVDPDTNVNGPTNQPSGSGAGDLQTVLGLGNETGPNDITINSNQLIKGDGNATISLGQTGSVNNILINTSNGVNSSTIDMGTSGMGIYVTNGVKYMTTSVIPTRTLVSYEDTTYGFGVKSETYRAIYQSTNGSTTTILTEPLANNSLAQVEVIITGAKSDYTKALTMKINASFRYPDITGIATEFGNQFIIENNEFNTATASLSLDGTSLKVNITGEASTTIKWKATMTVTS